MKPIRIQRSRKKGSKLPPNTVCVSRGTKWGNPYRLTEFARDAAIIYYRNWLQTGISYVHDEPPPSTEEIVRELRGKNLACWCRISETCHADVLLEIANSEGVK